MASLQRTVGRLGRSAHSLPRIDSAQQWARLAVRPGYHAIARTETVKFAVDLHRDERTHFIDCNRYEMHFDFVLRAVDPRAVFDVFNRVEYTSPDRRFMLGSVMHYLDGNLWTVELAAGDTMAADRIAWLFDHIAQRCGVADDLHFRAASLSQIDAAETIRHRIPVLAHDAVNANIAYQPIVLGEAFGTVRVVRGELDVATLRPSDIVVVDHVPEEIPPVAALVTGELQAPLAHVAVLCRNRNTPDMASRGAADDAAFTAYEGHLVKLIVGGQDFTITPADRGDAERAWSAMRPAATFTPSADLTVDEVFDVDHLPPDAINFVGAKTAQLGELGVIDGIETPGGFAVPFSAYARHLEASGVTARIDELLSDSAFLADTAVRASQLAAVRTAIGSHPVDETLLHTIRAEIARRSTTTSFIFRSSTNAEDLEGFNGAGLYESLVIPADPTHEQIADTLRAVWSSVWLQRAFEEREWYRIDHRGVAMSVLIQPFVEDALATGVAITGNPFNERVPAVYVNTQVAGTTVTGARSHELPEQYLVPTWSTPYEPELLSRSSLTAGELLLHEDDARRLTELLVRIHEAMLPAGSSSNAMDVEFSMRADRSFVIVQARPYNIVYSGDRARREIDESAFERTMFRVRRVLGRVSELRRTRSSRSERT